MFFSLLPACNAYYFVYPLKMNLGYFLLKSINAAVHQY